jgi:hypothetical protein
MILANSLLYGLLAALVTFKVVLLAVAVVLFVHGLAQRIRRRETPRAPAPATHRKLDVHV